MRIPDPKDWADRSGLVVDGQVDKQTLDALGVDWSGTAAPSGVYNDKYGVYFDALVAGSFFSHNPDDMGLKRSIRMSNPGALNYSNWQRSRPGYVGLPRRPTAVPTAIGPPSTERRRHGVAAWFVLLSKKYGYENQGRLSLEQLAKKYTGSDASASAVRAYVKGWSQASGGTLNADSVFRLNNTDEMLSLAKAMYAHEIGGPSPAKGRTNPLRDRQAAQRLDARLTGR